MSKFSETSDDRTEALEHKIKALKEKVSQAQFVLVGIGEEFNEDFKNIAQFPRLMAALEEVDVDERLVWTVPFLEKLYLEKNDSNRYTDAYKGIHNLIKDKNYFIISTCIDNNISKAGFDKDKIVQPCGGYEYLQCEQKCCSELYPAKPYSDLLLQAIKDGVGLDSVEMPLCPHCGSPLRFNNIVCGNYIVDGYKQQWERYTKWLQSTLNRQLCVLELGVGMNLPDIIRWPFEKVAFYNQKASFFRVNESLYQLPENLSDKGIEISEDSVELFGRI